MTVTSEDIARLAGVSRATVSYVVNNGPRPVSEPTRQRVLEVIQQTGYQPNAVARNLRLQRSSTLGLIVPDTHNSYFSEVARGIEDVAFHRGYAVFLCHSGSDINREIQYVNLLKAQQVAGVIWIPGSSDFEPFYQLKSNNIQTVVIDRISSDEDVPTVTADNFNGGFLATQHLIRLGHKRIGYINRPVEMSHSRGRFEGYQSALQTAGIKFDKNLVIKGGFKLENGCNAAHQLLERNAPPTALFAYNDIMALGALRACYETGLKVPDDFSIIGFDDIAESAFSCPALTTIHLPKFEMGQQGANLIISLIENQPPPAETSTPLNVELIVRESTGPVNEDLLLQEKS